MTVHTPTSIVLIGLHTALAGPLDTWLQAHVAAPLKVAAVRTFSDGLTYLRSHHVDLAFVDEAAAQHDLHAISTTSPVTAIIGLMMRRDDSALLHMLRQGAHEVLCLLSPAEAADPLRAIKQALARVNSRAGLLKNPEASQAAPAYPQLVHDLNNLLTSINGFADLVLGQLPPDNPARIGAEQIRLAGKRAAALLKTCAPAAAAPPPHFLPAAQSVTIRAA